MPSSGTPAPDLDSIFRYSNIQGAHFVAHGITGKDRYTKITVLWVGCKVHLVNPL